MLSTKCMELLTDLVFIFSVVGVVESAQKFSCLRNASGLNMEENLEDLSGDWYEVIRFPVSRVPACVVITAPTTVENDIYRLHVTYRENINKPWTPMDEQLDFFWNDETKMGTFELVYEGEDNGDDVRVTFHIMRSLFRGYLLVCGYSPQISKVELFKVLSRQQFVPESDQQALLRLIEQLGIKNPASAITWVEHGEICNGGRDHSTPFITAMITIILLIVLHLK